MTELKRIIAKHEKYERTFSEGLSEAECYYALEREAEFSMLENFEGLDCGLYNSIMDYRDEMELDD